MFKLFKKEKKKPKEFSDEELFAALLEDKVEITQEQIQKAKKNDRDTLFVIGWYYHERDLNCPKGFAWISKAAHQNCDAAQNSMGWSYLKGNAVSKDYKLAVEWFQKSATLGCVAAQVNLAWMYAHGLGVSKDYKQAMTWYLKADENGSTTAANNIGNLYLHGEGVSRNVYTAIEWFKKAAENGFADAMYNLGVIYHKSREVKDIKLAVYWYQKGAEKNHPESRKGLEQLRFQ